MGGTGKSGPIYDDAMKVLADDDTGALLALLGVTDVRERLTIEVTQPAMRADLLVGTGAGIVHVEFVTSRNAELGRRMVGYWNRIHQAHASRPIAQYVLLVGDRADAPHRYVHCRMSLDWTVVRVADLDPATLLATPTTAALAVLARGDDRQRAEVLRAAAERISAVPERDRGTGLMAAAITLASIVLSGDTIEQALKETTMPVLIRDTPLGRKLYDEAIAEGRAVGHAQGHAEGRAAVLRALICQRFGDDDRIDAIVERLLALPDPACLARVTSASSLDELTG